MIIGDKRFLHLNLYVEKRNRQENRYSISSTNTNLYIYPGPFNLRCQCGQCAEKCALVFFVLQLITNRRCGILLVMCSFGATVFSKLISKCCASSIAAIDVKEIYSEEGINCFM